MKGIRNKIRNGMRFFLFNCLILLITCGDGKEKVSVVVNIHPVGEQVEISRETRMEVKKILEKRLKLLDVKYTPIQEKEPGQFVFSITTNYSNDQMETLLESKGEFRVVGAGKIPLQELPPNDAEERARSLSEIIANKDVEMVTVEKDVLGKEVLSLRLTSDGAKKVYEFTQNHLNEYACIIVDHRIVECPVIRTPISGGIMVIAGFGYAPDEMRWMRSLILSPLMLPSVRVEAIINSERRVLNRTQANFFTM